MKLSEKIKAQATATFRRQLFQRAIDGETIKAGEYYLFTDGYTVTDRRATEADVNIVADALDKARSANK